MLTENRLKGALILLDEAIRHAELLEGAVLLLENQFDCSLDVDRKLSVFGAAFRSKEKLLQVRKYVVEHSEFPEG